MGSLVYMIFSQSSRQIPHHANIYYASASHPITIVAFWLLSGYLTLCMKPSDLMGVVFRHVIVALTCHTLSEICAKIFGLRSSNIGLATMTPFGTYCKVSLENVGG